MCFSKRMSLVHRSQNIFSTFIYILHSGRLYISLRLRVPIYFIQGTCVLHSGHLYFIQDTYILHSGHLYFIQGAYNQIILHSGHLCTSFRAPMYFIQDTYVLHSGRLYIYFIQGAYILSFQPMAILSRFPHTPSITYPVVQDSVMITHC